MKCERCGRSSHATIIIPRPKVVAYKKRRLKPAGYNKPVCLHCLTTEIDIEDYAIEFMESEGEKEK